MVYGWTLHRELENLVGAGVSPYQAVLAATRNPAEFFGARQEWGTVEIGRRADLVLLAANPLADIKNSTRIDGVWIGGRWLPRAELDRMIDAARQQINGEGRL
jgi:imidazolonepropionase-like amidohydrolase